MIQWIKCSERMPPDDGSEIILKDYCAYTRTNGMTARRVHLVSIGYTRWIPYTKEAWEELNK